MPDRMPDRMPEDMSDRMPEDLPVRKSINVMVGITRSKVILHEMFCKSHVPLWNYHLSLIQTRRHWTCTNFSTAGGPKFVARNGGNHWTIVTREWMMIGWYWLAVSISNWLNGDLMNNTWWFLHPIYGIMGVSPENVHIGSQDSDGLCAEFG